MDYKKSRDAAWKILIKNHASALPISVYELCRAENIRLVSYEEGGELIDKLNLREHTIENDAFSFSRIVFYNSETMPERQRFSIAHEIGHIVLHKPTGATVMNREISPNDNPIETEANIFASRLLAPLCILHFLNLNSAEEIAEYCSISMTAAKIRYQRLCDIRQRDQYLRQNGRPGCFLLSPLERKVYKNFAKYIKKSKK